MIGIIYKYTSPSNKSYIGLTIHEQTRKLRHKHAAEMGVDTKFYRAVRKYGWDKFNYEILFIIDNDNKTRVKQKLDYMERYYIRKFDSYNNGYNMTKGGEGGNGLHTEEFKQKIIERMKLNNPAFHMTNEWRQHIGDSLRGKKMSDKMKHLTSERMKANNPMKNPEIASKSAATRKGKHLSEEHKAKISNSIKGIICSDIHKQKLSVIALNRPRDSKGHFIKIKNL